MLEHWTSNYNGLLEDMYSLETSTSKPIYEACGLIPTSMDTVTFYKFYVERAPPVYLTDEYFWRHVPIEHHTYDLYQIAARRCEELQYKLPPSFQTTVLCSQAVNHPLFSLAYIDSSRRSYTLCLSAVHKKGMDLVHVPSHHLEFPLLRAALSQNGLALQHVPLEKRTYELCSLAVSQTVAAFPWVPLDKRTKELSHRALSKDPGLYPHLPKDHQTKQLCALIMETAPDFFPQIVPEHQTPEMCRCAVHHQPRYLKYVHITLRTRALCNAAVKKDGMCLAYVPIEVQTVDLCREAILTTPKAIQFIWRPLNDDYTHLGWVAFNAGVSLALISTTTRSLCLAALRRSIDELAHVPLHYQNERFWIDLISTHPHYLPHIPRYGRTELVCYVAIRKNGLLLDYVPHSLKTEWLQKKAILQNPLAIQFVSTVDNPQELGRLAVDGDPEAFIKFPSTLFQSEEVCYKAMCYNGNWLEHVEPCYRTVAVCQAAFQSSFHAISFIPSDLQPLFVCPTLPTASEPPLGVAC
jgi:hypothetical protein